jgi:hypothetical protein
VKTTKVLVVVAASTLVLGTLAGTSERQARASVAGSGCSNSLYSAPFYFGVLEPEGWPNWEIFTYDWTLVHNAGNPDADTLVDTASGSGPIYIFQAWNYCAPSDASACYIGGDSIRDATDGYAIDGQGYIQTDLIATCSNSVYWSLSAQLLESEYGMDAYCQDGQPPPLSLSIADTASGFYSNPDGTFTKWQLGSPTTTDYNVTLRIVCQ